VPIRQSQISYSTPARPLPSVGSVSVFVASRHQFNAAHVDLSYFEYTIFASLFLTIKCKHDVPLKPEIYIYIKYCNAARENTLSTGAELARTQKNFITQNNKLNKILSSCGLVIHVKARMLKAKTKTSIIRLISEA